MSDDELAFMQRFKKGELAVEAGTQILLEGAASPQLFTVLRGLGLRSKTLENGRRQVVNFVYPGDFLGLQSALMGEMKHSTEATTDMVLCVFDRRELWNLFRTTPERGYDLTFLGATEEHFLGDALATLGQRDARERIAWALMRLWRRAEGIGLVKTNRAPLPWKQQDLADAVGLSLVHTNKTLGRLRSDKVVDWAEGELILHNRPRLAELALFDDTEAVRRPLF